MSNRKTLDEQIKAAKLEKEQAENRIKELLKQQKEAERKARNHRLCSRGGIIEKGLPDIIRLTDEQFEVFVKKALLSGYAARIIKELLPPEPAAREDGNTDAPQIVGTAAGKLDSGNVPAPKPTSEAHSTDMNVNGKSLSGDTHPHFAPSPNPTNTTNNLGAHFGGKPFSGNAQAHPSPTPKPADAAHNGGDAVSGKPAEFKRETA